MRLNQQRKVNCFGRFGENDEERISRRFDFGGFLEAPENVPNCLPVSLQERDGISFAQFLLEPRRTDHVGKQLRQQANPMPASELLDLAALLRSHWEIHSRRERNRARSLWKQDS